MRTTSVPRRPFLPERLQALLVRGGAGGPAGATILGSLLIAMGVLFTSATPAALLRLYAIPVASFSLLRLYLEVEGVLKLLIASVLLVCGSGVVLRSVRWMHWSMWVALAWFAVWVSGDLVFRKFDSLVFNASLGVVLVAGAGWFRVALKLPESGRRTAYGGRMWPQVLEGVVGLALVSFGTALGFGLGTYTDLSLPSGEVTRADQEAFLHELEIPEGGHRSPWQIGSKLTIVYFWATSCAPCVDQLSQLSSLQHRYKRHQVEVVLVSVDEDVNHGTIMHALEGGGAGEVTCLIDDERLLWSEIHATALPTAVVLGELGDPIRIYHGSDRLQALELEVVTMLRDAGRGDGTPGSLLEATN